MLSGLLLLHCTHDNFEERAIRYWLKKVSVLYLFKLEDHTGPYWLYYGWCSSLFSFFNVFQV